MKISDGFKFAIGFVIGKIVLDGASVGFLKFVVKRDWENKQLSDIKSTILKDKKLCKRLNLEYDEKPAENVKEIIVQGFRG